MTDNRLIELPTGLFKELRFERIEEHYDTFMKFERINSEKLKPHTEESRHRLEISNLSFAYWQNFIFKGLDMTLESGKVYHLRGKNGAGKSTLSKILAGLIKPKPDSGFVYDGKKTKPYSTPGKLVGYTYQQCDDQLFSRTVATELGLTNQNNDTERKYIQSLAETFGLQEILSCHPFELPISMRKRLSIAATLAVDRPFYILDEPTLYLDDQNVTELQKAIIKLSELGKGIVLISHSKSFINLFSDIEIIDLLNHQI
jgi:energy-coupling factor transport system ATP-binding protein